MIRDLRSKGLGNTMDANMNEWPISVKKVKEKYEIFRELSLQKKELKKKSWFRK